MRADRSSFVAVFTLVIGLLVTGTVVRARQQQSVGEFLGGVSLDGHVHALATSRTQDLQNGNRNDSGAVDVNSVELKLTASPQRNVDATVVWLLEEGLNGGAPGDGFAVDQAYVTIAGTGRMLSSGRGRDDLNASPLYAKVGKFYVPFGSRLNYHTFDVVSEPQSLALSETLDSQLMLGVTPGPRMNVYAGAYSGSGPEQDPGQSIDDVYFGADVNPGFGSFSAAWTNNINNSITLSSELSPAEDAVGGVAFYGSVPAGPAQLQLQYVSAMDEYTQGNFNNKKPRAITSELTLGDVANFGRHPVDFTLVYGVTDEWFDHPETTRGAVVDIALVDGVTASAEYVNRKYDRALAGRLSETDIFSVRLAAGFSERLSP